MTPVTAKRRSSFTLSEKLLFTAGVLFCLVLITTSMMGGLLARYAAADAGHDIARVAKFHVDASSAADNLNVEYRISENNSGTYTIVVDNRSEVAVIFDVRVVVEKPEDSFDITVSLNDTTQDSSETSEFRFEEAGYAPPSGDCTLDLMFSVSDWEAFVRNASGMFRSETLKFRVYIDVVQAD